MNKKIVLVNPWIHDFAAYDFWSKPIGLLYLASILRKNGYDVHFIDCLNPCHPAMKDESRIKTPKRHPWGNGKYPKDAIKKPEQLHDFPRRYNRYGITPLIFKDQLLKVGKPDMFFVTSMMTYWYPGVFETINIISQTCQDSTIVLGGNYATLCSEHAWQYSGADIVITGEGEKYIHELCALPYFMPDFKILDSYPYPAFDLLNSIDQVPILTSRGCPYECTYCASHLLNSGFRYRDPIKVVDEIEFWYRNNGVKNFSIYDDAFLVDSANRAIPMMEEILRRGLQCSFHCPNGLHLREISDKVSALMFKSNFRTIRFGFETSSLKRQLETGGKITNDEAEAAIGHLKNAGYDGRDIGIYILCGLPGQSATEIYESITFIKSLGARPIIAEYSPIPGTQLWEESIAASSLNISEEPLYQNNTLLPCRGENLTYDMYQKLKNETRYVACE